MSDNGYTSKKNFRIGKRISATKGRRSAAVKETESPTGSASEHVYSVFDDGIHFSADKVFLDRFSDKIVSFDETVVCLRCGTRLWRESARQSLTGDYFCPRHGGWSLVRFLEKLFFGK